MRIKEDVFMAAFQARLTEAFASTPPYSVEGVAREALGEIYLISMQVAAKEADSPQEIVDFHKGLCISLIRDYETGVHRKLFNELLIEKVVGDIKPSP